MRRVRPSVASFGVVFAGAPVFGLFSTGMVVTFTLMPAPVIWLFRLRSVVGVEFLAGLFCFGRGLCLGSFFVQTPAFEFGLVASSSFSATWNSMFVPKRGLKAR